MKTILFLCALLSGAICAHAQINVDLSIDKDKKFLNIDLKNEFSERILLANPFHLFVPPSAINVYYQNKDTITLACWENYPLSRDGGKNYSVFQVDPGETINMRLDLSPVSKTFDDEIKFVKVDFKFKLYIPEGKIAYKVSESFIFTECINRIERELNLNPY